MVHAIGILLCEQVAILTIKDVEFATQDADPKKFYPMREPVAQAAVDLTKKLEGAQPAQLDALVNFASLAYRRPLADNEEAGLRRLYASLCAEGVPHDEALRLVLARVFSSPSFLYKQESPPAGVRQGNQS